MKDNLLISGLLALSILLIPLAVVILLVTSYGMLFGINYFLEHTALINLSPFKIQITHVLLGAVFLSIMFIFFIKFIINNLHCFINSIVCFTCK